MATMSGILFLMLCHRAGPPAMKCTPLCGMIFCYYMHKLHSFIHSCYFYSTSSSPLLIRGISDTAQILCQSFMPRRHRQLRVKDLPKVPTWWRELDLNLRPFG